MFHQTKNIGKSLKKTASQILLIYLSALTIPKK